MANKEKNGLQKTLDFLYKILEYIANVLGEDEARAEYLSSMGVAPTAVEKPDFSGLRSTSDYFKSEEGKADIREYKAAYQKLKAAYVLIREFTKAVGREQDGVGEAMASDIVTLLLNLGTMETVRLHYPKLHNYFQLSTVANGLSQEGGGAGFIPIAAWRYSQQAFGWGSDANAFFDDTSVQKLTDLLGIGGAVLGGTHEFGPYFLSTSFEANDSPDSKLPAADKASKSFLSFIWYTEVGGVPSNAQITLGFLPKNGPFGYGIALKTVAIGNGLQVPLGKGWALTASAAGDVNFLATEKKFAVLAGQSNRLAVGIGKQQLTADIPFWNLLDNPKLGFGIGNYAFSFVFDQKEYVDVRLSCDVLYELGGKNAGFPFNKIPKRTEDGPAKIPVALVANLRRRRLYFENGSTVSQPPAPAPATRAARAPAIPAILSNLLTVKFPTDISGPFFALHALNVALDTNDERTRLETSFDFTLQFGSVVTMSFMRAGFAADLVKNDTDGPLFGYDLLPDFKPPNGVGIVVDAKVVKGGGFLYIDAARGEYFGALELDFKELFTLKAVGLLQTRLPDGADDFSLMVIITTEFAPIQLGFGFTLLGVGGMLGLNRRLNFDQLQQGVKQGLLERLLFPENPVANISRIVGDLQRVFPAQKGAFVVGLMGKFGWGTPTLVTIQVAVLLELPNPAINLLGTVAVLLPSPESPLIVIKAGLLGRLDFQNKYLFFRADLYDSKLVEFELTGSLVFLSVWGGPTQGFVFSLGGFHRDFTQQLAAPGIPNALNGLERVRLSLMDEANGDPATLYIRTYFALTSNSVQFGGDAHLYVSGPWSTWLKGDLEVDVLIYFDPFAFQFDIAISVTIGRKGDTYAGIGLRGQLSGPRPWHVHGSASLDLCLFDVDIPFSHTWGDSRPVVLGATEDLLDVIRQEVAKDQNWRVEAPANIHFHVSRRELTAAETAAGTVVEPAGLLVFSQSSIPLGVAVQRVGNKRPKTVKRVTITGLHNRQRNQALSTQTVQASFAAGQYFDLTDEQRLTRRSFEPMDSGVEMNTPTLLVPTDAQVPARTVAHETIYPGKKAPATVPVGRKHPKTLLNAQQVSRLSRRAAVSQSSLSVKRQPNTTIIGRRLTRTGFMIVRNDTLAPYTEGSPNGAGYYAESRHEAQILLDEVLGRQPNLSDELQVLEAYLIP